MTRFELFNYFPTFKYRIYPKLILLSGEFGNQLEVALRYLKHYNYSVEQKLLYGVEVE